jgi:hypothetical protein
MSQVSLMPHREKSGPQSLIGIGRPSAELIPEDPRRTPSALVMKLVSRDLDRAKLPLSQAAE